MLARLAGIAVGRRHQVQIRSARGAAAAGRGAFWRECPCAAHLARSRGVVVDIALALLAGVALHRVVRVSAKGAKLAWRRRVCVRICCPWRARDAAHGLSCILPDRAELTRCACVPVGVRVPRLALAAARRASTRNPMAELNPATLTWRRWVRVEICVAYSAVGALRGAAAGAPPWQAGDAACGRVKIMVVLSRATRVAFFGARCRVLSSRADRALSGRVVVCVGSAWWALGAGHHARDGGEATCIASDAGRVRVGVQVGLARGADRTPCIIISDDVARLAADDV